MFKKIVKIINVHWTKILLKYKNSLTEFDYDSMNDEDFVRHDDMSLAQFGEEKSGTA